MPGRERVTASADTRARKSWSVSVCGLPGSTRTLLAMSTLPEEDQGAADGQLQRAVGAPFQMPGHMFDSVCQLITKGAETTHEERVRGLKWMKRKNASCPRRRRRSGMKGKVGSKEVFALGWAVG